MAYKEVIKGSSDWQKAYNDMLSEIFGGGGRIVTLAG